jgi:hypothetical protein
MKRTKQYYRIYAELSRRNIPVSDEIVQALLKVRRLAKKHERLAEMYCDGVGYVNGVTYYCGPIDEQTAGMKSAYIEEDWTIFEAESDKVEERITKTLPSGFTASFQGDPRGYTVRVMYGERDFSEIIMQ